jgi:hypothetical protein
MLDISFYITNGSESETVDVSETLYEWLARSDFSKIGGESIDTEIYIDEENVILPLVTLNQDIRQQFKKFFSEAIISESDAVLTKLGDSPSKEEYQAGTYRLRKMLELLKCVENENYQYLQRI